MTSTDSPLGPARLQEVVFDCADPATLAAWWAGLLGGRSDATGDAWATVRAALLGPLVLGFQRVPEAKAAKNRLHLDIEVADIDAATATATGLGAVVLSPVIHEDDGSFQVLGDPEGNEFCFVLQPPDRRFDPDAPIT